MSPWVQPGPTRTVRVCRVDAHALHRREVDDQAVVAAAEPRPVVAAAANGEQRPFSRAKLTAAITSATSAQRAIISGRLSIMPL